MSNNVFSSHVKRIRSNNNFTMQEFAEKIGAKKSSVSMWENNGVVPRYETLVKISQTFDISIDELLGNQYNRDLDNADKKISYLHRNLKKLDNENLEKAETILKSVFMDIFEEEDENDEIF